MANVDKMFPESLAVGGVDFTLHKDGDLEIDIGDGDGRWNGRYISRDDRTKLRDWLTEQTT